MIKTKNMKRGVIQMREMVSPTLGGGFEESIVEETQDTQI